MKITVSGGPRLPEQASLLAIPVHEGKGKAQLDPAWQGLLHPAVRRPIACGDFLGKPNTQQMVYGETPFPRQLLVGLGPARDLTPEVLRRYGGSVAQVATDTSGGHGVLLLPTRSRRVSRPEAVRAIVEGLSMGAYNFARYRTENTDKRERITSLELRLDSTKALASARRAAQVGLDNAYGVNLCREVGNLPSNDLGPEELAARAREEGKAAGLKVRILDERAIAKERMGALLGVSRGSARPPRFIILEYEGRGKRSAPLVFVGKAITFDSGGISLKPADGMQDMKFDMCGGGAVLGALCAIGRIRPKRRVVGIIASAENMPDGNAIRPGDILTSAKGLTIEIINTDAEGRLALADGLYYAERYAPELVVDVATLTGACVVALGTVHTGLFSRDPKLAERVRLAAERVGEKLWPLPLDDPYFELVRSDVADLKNSGGRRAGAITAAAFLARFAANTPWVHLDIAGTGWTDQVGPYQRKGATGAAVRTLVELAEH